MIIISETKSWDKKHKNKNANQKQAEELCKNMKDDNTTFKTILEKQRFDPNKLKEHFKTHLGNIQSIEVKNVPRFIRQM